MTTTTTEIVTTNAPERPGVLRVLIVDDYADCAESMALLLGMYGHEVEVARSGPTALQMAQAGQPDVVLLDIGLPGMSGYDVARELKEQRGEKRPLIIAVTGFGQDADRRRSAELGIDLHMVK